MDGGPNSTSAFSSLNTDLVFNEFMYRLCRDTLFWIEAEKLRTSPTNSQKATFILRTFFTKNADFCLNREELPPSFEILFSQQRPANSTSLILEVQDHVKNRLASSLGPSFAQSSMMKQYQSNPAVLLKELSNPSTGGCLATLLAPRPVSVSIPTPTNSGSLTSPSGPLTSPLISISSPLVINNPPPSSSAQVPATADRHVSPPPRSTAPQQPLFQHQPPQQQSQEVPISLSTSNSEVPPAHVSLSSSNPIQVAAQQSSNSGNVQSSSNAISSSPPGAINMSHQQSLGNQATFVSALSSSLPKLPMNSSMGGSSSPSSSSSNINTPSSSNATSSNYVAGTPKGHSKENSMTNLDRRPSRGFLADGTITSTQLKMGSPSLSNSPPTKPVTPRTNVIQMASAVRDKLGLAKRDKERKEREKYYDVLVNGWMMMESPTLDDMIHDAQLMILFYDFLKSIHAEENMIGWLEIELYKSSTASIESRRNNGVDLLVQFFEPSSKSLIDIEGVNYKDILKHLNERPSRDLFDSAQRVLWDQLAFQCFARFKESDTLRKLFEEPNIKGKKKELTKMAQKIAKANPDNISRMAKLEEFSKFRAGFVPLIPNVSEREFQIEDVLYAPDLLVAFREYLNVLPTAEFLDGLSFWFEVEVWKYSNKENSKEIALQIFREYLLSPGVTTLLSDSSSTTSNSNTAKLNTNAAPPNSSSKIAKLHLPQIDLKVLELELQARPDRNSFTRCQVLVWRKLKLETFSNFESSDTLTKFFEGNLPMRQNLPIVKHCEYLNEVRSKNANESLYKANVARVASKVRLKRQEVQGATFDLDFMLTDREYVGLLLEFLDKRQARENLNFWVEAEYWKYLVSPGDKRFAASTIWDRFFSDKAEITINVDVADRLALQNSLKDTQQLPENLFIACQDQIHALITYDLLPKFSSSEQGARMLKASKRRPPNQPLISLKSRGLEGLKELRNWLNERNVPFEANSFT